MNPSRWAARTAGVLLLASTYLPVQRLLDPAVTGRAGQATRAAVEPLWQLAWLGTAVVLTLAGLLAWRAPSRWIRSAAQAVGRELARIPASGFAWAAGGVAATLAAAAGAVVFHHEPTLVDEMVQLLHARVLAGGHVAAALPDPVAAWEVQNGWVTDAGWTSVYPPGHTVLLALGFLAGAPWLVGPVMVGVAVALTARSLERLWPDRPGPARIGLLLLALSPFMLFLGSGYLSHVSASAFAALTLWSALRARDGEASWALLTGAAVGAFVCTRPWTGVVVAGSVVGATWWPAVRRRGLAWIARRAAWTVAGGAPFAAALLAWNAWLFGGPFRLGYTVAFGPAHGLGFHPDPWGNAYGPLEAVAYTGTDLVQLGLHLWETPVPATLPLALLLVWGRRLPSGSGPLVAWALAPVLANAVYWHHGIHMGPRMLFEAAPAWILLGVAAVAGLAGRESALPRSFRDGVAWSALLSLVAAPFLAADLARVYAPSPAARTAAGVPTPPTDRAAVVLVHGSWASRVSARLTAAGMRRDSVETALRRNDLCAVERYVAWREAGSDAAAPALDLVPRSGTPQTLTWAEISPGNRVRVRPGVPLDPPCAVQARADRLGTVELEPLLWQVGLPAGGGGPVFARDLGPALNRRILATFPDRAAWVYLPPGPGVAPRGTPSLLPYREAMRLLWSAAGDGG